MLIKLFRQLFSYGILSVLNKFITFLALPILINIVSISEFGVLDLVIGISSVFGFVISLSLDSGILRFWYSKYINISYQKYLISTSFFLISICFSFFFLITIIFFKNHIIDYLGQSNYFLYIVISFFSVYVSSISSLCQVTLRLSNRIKLFSIVSVIINLLYFGSFYVFISYFSLGIGSIFYAQLFSQFFGLIILFFFTKQYFGFSFSLDLSKKLLVYCLPILPATLVTWVSSQLDRFIINNFFSLEEVAIFGLVSRVSVLFLLGIYIFRQAWAPLSMEILHDNNKKTDSDNLYLKVFDYYIYFTFVIFIFVACFSFELYQLMFPKKYISGIYVLPLLLLSHGLHGLGTIVNIGVIISKKTYINTLVSITSVVVNVFLTVIFVREFSYLGAGFGVLASEFVFIFMLIFYSKKFNSITFSKLKILTWAISSLIVMYFFIYISFFEFSIYIIFFFKLFVLLVFLLIIYKVFLKDNLSLHE
jgi:O-antigen/teichoic acid export membrane protein